MITVATVCKSGSIYTPELWVDRLYHQVRKWMPKDVAWKFRCLTDTPMPWQFRWPARRVEPWDGYATVPLVQDWPGWWSKIELWRPGLFDGLVLYLDLDTLIVGSLAPFLEYGGRFAALSDFGQPAKPESGVMLWQAGEVDLYRLALKNNPIMQDTAEARWWDLHEEPDRLQDIFPGIIGSYKVDQLEDGPRDFSVCCFHGHPKQHHLEDTWVGEVWNPQTREGGNL